MKRKAAYLLSALIVSMSLTCLLTSPGAVEAYDTVPTLRSVSNLLADSASFEDIDTGTVLTWNDGTKYPSGNLWGFNANAGYFRATKAESVTDVDGTVYSQKASGTVGTKSEINPTVINTDAHSGEKCLYFSPKYFTPSLGLSVEKNKNYQLSYWILADKDVTTNDVVNDSVISTTLNVGQGGTNAHSLNKPLNQVYDNFIMDIQKLSTVHDGLDWKKVTHTFNSGDFEKLYLVIRPTGRGKGPVGFKVDDFSLTEAVFAKVDLLDMKAIANIEEIDCSFNNLVVGSAASFKVIHSQPTSPVVKVNGVTLTADNGVYTFTVAENNKISVRFAGDEDINSYNKDKMERPLDKYNLDVYLEPVWQGDTVYQESALFTTAKDTVRLLYPIDRVVSLRSYSLDKAYVEGVDYEITSEGEIKRLANSKIPVYNADNFYDPNSSWAFADGSGNIRYTSDADYSNWAVSVTYEHSKTFADGYQPAAPASQTEKIKNTIAKLQKGEKVNIVVYGDSISCGWSSSGLNSNGYNNDGSIFKPYLINSAPYAPTWIEMLSTKFEELYPGQVTIKTIALGGKSAAWGSQNVAERLTNLFVDESGKPLTPDLMLFGFGVNDSNAKVTTDSFKSSMQGIITNARSLYPNMEVVMYSPMLPNQLGVDWPASRLLSYQNAMKEIAAANQNVGMIELTSIFTEIVKCKAPEDYLSSYLNHGNDFTARMYATAVLAAIKPDALNTAYNGLAAVAVKENSTSGKNGMRIYNSITKAFIAENNITEFGSVAIREENFTGRLKVDTYNSSAGGITPSQTDKLWSEDENEYIYTAYLTNVSEKYYGESYLIRAYAKDSSGNYYYGEVFKVTLYDVVYAIDKGRSANGSAPSTSDIAAFNAFANSGDSFAAYDAWLETKGYTSGSLRNLA